MKSEIKTAWEIREWVEEAITDEQLDRDLSWSEIHYDKWGKEYDELHIREDKKWISLDSLDEIIIKLGIQGKSLLDLRKELGLK